MQRARVPDTGATVAVLLALFAPAARGAWPAGSAPEAPLNFAVEAYARGLDAPQALLPLPNGDVLVSELRRGHGRLTLLRDTDRGGRADQQHVLIDAELALADLALRRDRLYLAEGDGIRSCPFLVGQTRLHGRCRTLREPAVTGDDGRVRQSLKLSRDESALLSTAGRDRSGEAASTEAAPRVAIEMRRGEHGAALELGSVLGSPLALAVEPRTGLPWVAVGMPAGPDRLVPLANAAVVERLAVPLAPHSAPFGLAFYEREQFPKGFRGGAFVALHGEAGSAAAAGAKVVFVPFENGRPAAGPQEFLGGFAATDGAARGRPAALAVAADGSLLIADDLGGIVWRVRFKCASCTPDPLPASRTRTRGTH